jgi:hypothetical protein
MSIFNPWVLLGIITAVLTSFGSGYYKGKHDESNRNQIEVARLNAEARQTEQRMGEVARTYSETLRKSQNVAKTKETKLRADIATGNLRLSIPTQGSVCPSPDTASATGSNGGEAGAEPGGSTDVAADLLQIAADGDAAIRKLNTCIQTYETLRNMK